MENVPPGAIPEGLPGGESGAKCSTWNIQMRLIAREKRRRARLQQAQGRLSATVAGRSEAQHRQVRLENSRSFGPPGCATP